MHVDWGSVRANVREACTEDLLDRATVYREGMESEALAMIEQELRARGINRDAIAEHERSRRQETLFDAQGITVKCHCCPRPAVVETWGWHRLWGLVPLFPRRFAWCAEHKPRNLDHGSHGSHR